MSSGATRLMNAYPTLQPFLKSMGRYRKSYRPLTTSSSVSSSIAWVYLFGMFLIMSVVRGSWPPRTRSMLRGREKGQSE